MNTSFHSSASAAPRTGRLVTALTLLLLAWSLAVLLVSPDLVQGIRMVIRLTARTSLVLFLLAFTASAMARRWPTPQTAWLLGHRRAFGLSFAMSHAVHLAAIVAFAMLDGPAFAQQSSLGTMVTGGLAYVFIALMAATSWDGAVKWLGARRWQLLHTVGAWYIWISFVVTFGKRIPVSVGYAVPVVVLMLALLLKIGARRRANQAAH